MTYQKEKLQKVTILTTHTRIIQDESLFISFDDLHLNLKRDKVEKALKEGLEESRDIIQFGKLKTHTWLT